MRKTYHRLTIVIAIALLYATAVAQETISVKQSLTGNTVEHWKPFILSSAADIKVPAPPTAAQSIKEVAELKKKMKAVDDKLIQQIRYWDAGAPAYRWNEIANSFVNPQKPTFFRFPTAWVNMAIYDATLVAWRAKYEYNRKRPSEADASIKPLVSASATPSYPCEHTVTAAAAATVLAYFYPEVGDSLLALAKEAAQSRTYAGVQYPSDVAIAWKIGEQVAQRIIERAKTDGSDLPFKGQMPTDPKLWRGDYPVGANVRNHKPIFMKSANQFRPPPPPDFGEEMKQMKEFRQDFNSTYLALRWAALSGFDIWTELASKKIFEEHLDRNTPLCARIYALLHTAIYDAAIAIMDAKYAYWGIRPNQYDTGFKPLIPTPPFPGYPSGHATASSTAATILSYFFPADKSFFKRTAQECADSRFYGGIHFKIDNETGLQLGDKLGTYIINTWDK